MQVQFSDAGQTVIVSYFGTPQDATEFPEQGTVETSDPRWAAYYDASPPFLQRSLPAPTSS